MFSKLDAVVKRYEELGTKLSDPQIIQDQKQFQKFAKERSALEDLVQTYQEYLQITRQITDNKEMLGESDAEIREMAKDELVVLEAKKLDLEEGLKVLLLPKDPNDEKNILLEIRAGTGGEEAALFAAELFRMYSRYAERKGWKVEVMDSNPTGIGGLKEIIALITGDNVYSDLKYEGGVHRVQRVPETEQQGRVHTSAVSVVVIPEAEDVEVDVNEGDLQVDVFRASGPGGQGVNTTDSAVRLTHRPSGLVVVCRDERSQIKNKAKALKILKSRLLDVEREKQDSAERSARQLMIRSGDRSDKIRTYNFPQNRVTDHRIGLTLHQLDLVIEGKLDEIIQSLRTHEQAELMKGSA